MNFARTKIQVPRPRAVLIERASLGARLLEALCTRRAVLLCAPAGYGKTTLLAQQMARLPVPTAVAWVSADADDDLPRLLECLLAALDPFDPPWRTAPEALVARVAASADDQRSVVAELINTLDACEAPQGVIVFDDVHRVHDPDFFCFVDGLIERMCARWSVVLVSRQEPPLALARLRGAGELAEFRRLDLQFARDEALRLAQATGIEADLADQLFDRTQGWPAGMRIAIGAARGADGGAMRAGERPLFEFLVTEVLQQLEPGLADFLLAASVLPELDPARCAAVTGDPRAALMLEEVERLGLFVDVLDAPPRSLRLHALFRDALQQHLRRGDPGRLATLRRRAAATEPDPVRRIALWLDAGDTDAAAALVFDHLPSLIVTQGSASVLNLVSRFPEAAREQSPEIAFVRALAHWAHWDFRTMLVQLERAARGFAARGDRRSEQLASAEGAMALMALGRLDEAAGRLARLRAEELPVDTRILVLNAEAWLAIDSCRHGAVAPLVSKMLDLLEQVDRSDLWFQTTPPLRMPGLPGIAPVLARHAELLLRAAGDSPSPLRAHGLLSLAWCALWEGRLEEARELVEAARGDAQWSGETGAVRAHLLALAAVLGVVNGDVAGALEAARARLQTFAAEASEWHRYLLSLFVARIAASCEDAGELRAAWRQVEAARALLGDAATPAVTEPRELPIEAQLAWLEGRERQAEACWTRALENEEAIDLQGQAVETRLRLARALLRQGELAAAARWLKPVFARARREPGPGGALLAGPVLGELATASWADLLGVPERATLLEWSGIVDAERAQWQDAALDRRAGGGQGGSAAGAGLALIARLTPRELEVLGRIAAGDSNKHIARALDLSLHTVKRHVANILSKLGVDTRRQASDLYRSPP